MTMTRTVRLEGGPRHGDLIQVDATQKLKTVEWEEETVERDLDRTTVYATRVGVATYREITVDVFEFVPTPTGLGDVARILKGDR